LLRPANGELGTRQERRKPPDPGDCEGAVSWAGKPCARCQGKKGPSYATRKHCGRCAPQVRKQSREAAHERAVADRYGLAAGDYGRLYAAQSGICAICQRATGRTRRLSVDHDHLTGRVRGLLCRPCNDLLGHARDSEAFFLRVLTYLRSPPADAVLH